MRANSTAITDISYDARASRLWVGFQSGERNGYEAVPANVHQCLIQAASKGAFFARHVRDRYPFVRLDGDA
jgi:hypothetical protein